jgi:hypothetical protein
MRSAIRHALAGAILAALTAIDVTGALAGPELIVFPADYKTRFVLYNTVERPDRNPAVVRHFYANPEAVAAAKPREAAPYGTVLVMEDRKVALDAAGQPRRDAEGRFVVTDEVVAIAIQEKRAGWGASYAPEKRNGEWEYAVFGPDGAARPTANLGPCFTCHLNRTGRDYTFTFVKWVIDGKP